MLICMLSLLVKHSAFCHFSDITIADNLRCCRFLNFKTYLLLQLRSHITSAVTQDTSQLTNKIYLLSFLTHLFFILLSLLTLHCFVVSANIMFVHCHFQLHAYSLSLLTSYSFGVIPDILDSCYSCFLSFVAFSDLIFPL